MAPGGALQQPSTAPEPPAPEPGPEPVLAAVPAPPEAPEEAPPAGAKGKGNSRQKAVKAAPAPSSRTRSSARRVSYREDDGSEDSVVHGSDCNDDKDYAGADDDDDDDDFVNPPARRMQPSRRSRVVKEASSDSEAEFEIPSRSTRRGGSGGASGAGAGAGAGHGSRSEGQGTRAGGCSEAPPVPLRCDVLAVDAEVFRWRGLQAIRWADCSPTPAVLPVVLPTARVASSPLCVCAPCALARVQEAGV